MGTIADIRGKTEQRVTAIIKLLQASPESSFTYEELSAECNAHYDVCLYVMATLCEVGMVERVSTSEGPGRPKIRFRWIGSDAQELGSS
jgi:hypothetical protein